MREAVIPSLPVFLVTPQLVLLLIWEVFVDVTFEVTVVKSLSALDLKEELAVFLVYQLVANPGQLLRLAVWFPSRLLEELQHHHQQGIQIPTAWCCSAHF